jgi:hypothetical protein
MRSHGVEVTDARDGDSIQTMSRFIREHADIWKESGGSADSQGG